MINISYGQITVRLLKGSNAARKALKRRKFANDSDEENIGDAFLLEDGQSYLLLEDGISNLLLG